MQAIVDIRWSVATLAGLLGTLILFLALPGLAYKRTEIESSVMTVDFRDWSPEPTPIVLPPKKRPRKKQSIEKPQVVPDVKQVDPLPLAPTKEIPARQQMPVALSAPQLNTTPPVPSNVRLVPVPIFKLTALPRFAHKELPVYPAGMVRTGKEAVVQLEVLIDKDGKVREVTVLRSAGKEFDAAAMRAMRQSTFIPGNVAGEAVASLYRAPVKFELR